VVIADQDLHVAESAPASYVRSARNARKVVLARFGRVEKLLLGVYLPAYLVVLGLHAHEVWRSGLAQLPVYVRGVPGDYPVVAGYPVETDSSGSGLELGDRLIRLGERDLSGVGYVGFQAIGLARTRPGQPAPLVFERAGERRNIAVEARPHVNPWSRVPLLLLIPSVCVLVLLRAPGSAGARRLFVATITYGFAQAEFYGGPEWKTWLAALALNVAGTLAIGTVLHWARRFPDEMPETARLWVGVPWLAALLYLVFVRGSYLLGGPLPSPRGRHRRGRRDPDLELHACLRGRPPSPALDPARHPARLAALRRCAARAAARAGVGRVRAGLRAGLPRHRDLDQRLRARGGA
jgi:hypothetical protein